MTSDRHVVIGALNQNENAYSVGNIDGLNYIACAVGSTVVILNENFKQIQVIATGCEEQKETCLSSAVSCCAESGKVAIHCGSAIRVFEPHPQDGTETFPYRWCEAQSWLVEHDVDNVQWILGGLRLLVFAEKNLLLYQHKVLSCAVGGDRTRERASGVKFTITPDDESVWEVVWSMKLADRVKHVRVSYDGTLFATSSQGDPFVKIWYQLKDSHSYSFIYIQHPAPVCGFEWRRSGGYFMPRRCAHNALITWCEDNIARIWKEVPSQDCQVELHFINTVEKVVAVQQEKEHLDKPKRQYKMTLQMRKAKGRLMHKLTHLIYEKRKVSIDATSTHSASTGAAGPSGGGAADSAIRSSPTLADFSIPACTSSDTLVFCLAATIDADNDCLLVPSMSSRSDSSGKRRCRKPFTVHWLNNKEHQFILGTQQVLAETVLPLTTREQGAHRGDIQVMHSLHSSTSSAGLAAANEQLMLDVPVHHHQHPHHSITAPNLLTKAMASTPAMMSPNTEESPPSTKDVLDYSLEMLLRQWNKSCDILFAVHPIDGSLLTWTMEWLDDAWKQPTVSFASRLPDAFPVAEAASLSIWLNTLHLSAQYGITETSHKSPDGERGEDSRHNSPMHFIQSGGIAPIGERNDVCLLSVHENHTLNLWRLQIDQNERSHCFGMGRRDQGMPLTIVSVLHECRVCPEQKSEGGTLLEVLHTNGLMDAADLSTPLLPQYHPVQLVGMLNAGRIQRVRAILLNILKTIFDRQQNTTPWFKSSTGRRRHYSRQRSRIEDYNPQSLDAAESQHRRDSISARTSFEAEGPDFDDLDAINPLPLHALLAADSVAENAASEGKVRGKLDITANQGITNVYDSLFAAQTVDEDLDLNTVDVDSFSLGGRKHSLGGGPPRKISSGSIEMMSSSFSSSNPDAPPATKLTAKHSRLLTEMLTHIHLPGLSSVDQMHLLAVADTVAHFSANAMVDKLAQANADFQPVIRSTLGDSTASGYAATGAGLETVDECGLRFLMAKKQHEYLLRCLPLKQRRRLKTMGISSAHVIWAFHSDTEMELLNSIPCCQRQQESWDELRSYGVAWWLRNNATLRVCMERVAKNAFQRDQNPMDAALFYLAMRKKNVVTQLFRSVNDTRMYEFLREDFTVEKWQKAALKNAFVLMSKQRYQHAAAFFLLGGSLKDALQTILNRLTDLQLAMVVLRLYETDSERQFELTKELLSREILHCEPEKVGQLNKRGDEEHVKFPSGSRDPFERSMALWMMKEYALSASTLLEETSIEQEHTANGDKAVGAADEDRRGSISKMGAKSLSHDVSLPDVFNFYSFLRRHPLVIRQKLANAGISTTSTEQFLTWTRRIGAKVSASERRLYFRTATAHLSSGCPILALDVLSRLPSQITDTNWTLPLEKQNSPMLSEQGAQKAEEIDWSTTVSAGRREEEKLELNWSDEEKDEEEQLAKEVVEINEQDRQSFLQTESKSGGENLTAPLDLAAQKLKLLATLGIMTDELNTLVVRGGYEVAGGQLRLELFSWLEKECDVLDKICLQDDSSDGHRMTEEPFLGEEGCCEETSSISESLDSSVSTAPPPLHEALRQDRNDLRERVRHALRRRTWLARHQKVLYTLAFFCALHGSANSRLIAVQMELLLLLLEVQQNEKNAELRHPPNESLPEIHSFPLLVSSIAVVSSVTSPLRFMTDQYSNLIHTINEFAQPPQIDADKIRVQTLFNLCQVLSLCVYQSMSGVESLTKSSPRFSGPLTQPTRRHSSVGAAATCEDDACVVSAPSQWPGVSSLVALLTRERMRAEESSPNLRLLLTEFFCAIVLSLFCNAFALYDSRWLYRLCAHPTDANMFAQVFGGGGERRLKSAVPTRPPPPTRPPNPPNRSEQIHSIDQIDSTAAIRAKLHAKVFRIEGGAKDLQKIITAGQQQHKGGPLSEQIVQCWVPPKKHVVQYFAEKVRREEPSPFDDDYNSDDEKQDESETENDADDATEQLHNNDEFGDNLGGGETPVLPHDLPKSYAWTLMRLTIVRHVRHKLAQFIEMVGFDLQEIAHLSPKMNLALKRLNSWAAQLEDELDGWADGCPAGFLPNMQIQTIKDSADALGTASASQQSRIPWNSPLLNKYRVLLDRANTPFEYEATGVRSVRRLWIHLICQEHLMPIFVRYIFGKGQDKVGSVARTSDVNNILSVVKLVHREHDPIVAFAVNSIRPGYIALSTGRELQELSIERLLDERERINSRLSQFSSTSSFLIGQNRAELDLHLQQIRRDPLRDNDDYQLLIPGGDSTGRSIYAQTSSNIINTFIVDRSRFCLQKLRKRPISGIRRLESHSSLPYYVSGSSDGSIFLWEWGVEQPVFVARVAGQYAKVVKLAFAQNGSRFAAVDGDGLLCIWQAQSGVPARKPYFSQKCHNKFASDVKFLGQTSTLLVTAGHTANEQNVVLWDTLMPQSKSVVHAFVGHSDGAYCVAYQSSTQSIFSGGKHGEICIWDVRQRQLRTTLKAFEGATSAVRCICLDPNGDMIAAGSNEGDIKIWTSANSPQLLHSLPTEHAARSGFSLRQVASISLQGVQQIEIDSKFHLFSCGADNTLKMRTIPHFCI